MIEYYLFLSLFEKKSIKNQWNMRDNEAINPKYSQSYRSGDPVHSKHTVPLVR